MRTPMTKTFGGKRYEFYATYIKKTRANTVAKNFRNGGEAARIVKDKATGQWALYVRYGKGRGF